MMSAHAVTLGHYRQATELAQARRQQQQGQHAATTARAPQQPATGWFQSLFSSFVRTDTPVTATTATSTPHRVTTAVSPPSAAVSGALTATSPAGAPAAAVASAAASGKPLLPCEGLLNSYIRCMEVHEGVKPDPYETEFCEEYKQLYRACRAEQRAAASSAAATTKK